MSREQNKLRQHIDECLKEREHREREPEDEYLDYHDDLDLLEDWSWQQEDYWKDAYDDRETEREKWEREDYEDWLDWEVSVGEPILAEFGGRMYPEPEGGCSQRTKPLNRRVEMATHGDEWCQCENCRTLRAAEKAVLEHGGKEYVPEEKFPSIPYSLVVETLCQRILDLIPAHPEILKVHDVWDLFEVPGFECEDLHPSGAQASSAFAKAKQLHRQGQTVNPDLIT